MSRSTTHESVTPVGMKRKSQVHDVGPRKRSTARNDRIEVTRGADLSENPDAPHPSLLEEAINRRKVFEANFREDNKTKAEKRTDKIWKQKEKVAIQSLRGTKGQGKKKEEIKFANEDEAKQYVATERRAQRVATDKKWQNKVDKENSLLQKRAADRLAGRKPAVETPPRVVYPHNPSPETRTEYETKLAQLSVEKPTEEQLSEMAKAQTFGPNYFARTSSLSPGNRFHTYKRRTNGFTLQTLIMPRAETSDEWGLHVSMSDMTQGELVYSLGHRLIWTDLRSDQFNSYTNSPIFMVTLALVRQHWGQKGTTIQFIDRRKAVGIDQKPAKFYPALALYDIFKVPHAAHWDSPQRISLHARKFTQEYLSYHIVRVEDDRFRQATIEALIHDGLYDIFPGFEVPWNHKRAGLYTSQVCFRKIGFPPMHGAAEGRKLYSYKNCSVTTPLTNEFLEKVKKITLNFMRDDKTEATTEPHLHIFITFLSFQKRPRNDKVFMTWVTTHYTAVDVVDLCDDGKGGVRPDFTRVADNLPDLMQYLDLVRDARDAFGLLQLPNNEVSTHNVLTGDKYEAADILHHQNAEVSYEYYEHEQQDKRNKASAKRKEKKAGSTNAQTAGPTTALADVGTDNAQEDSDGAESDGTVDGEDGESGVGNATTLSPEAPGGTEETDDSEIVDAEGMETA